MTLREFIKLAGVTPSAIRGEVTIGELTSDSRQVSEGSLFFCLPGSQVDGHDYAMEALSAGASSVLVRNRATFELTAPAPAILLEEEGRVLQRSVAKLASAFFGEPSRKLRVIGVTGTNGKTTTAWMIADALQALGRKCAYLGTLGFRLNGSAMTLSNTTPFPLELQKLLYDAVEAGMDDIVLEVSSHALAEGRVESVHFDVGIFTNLSQDHLDFHGSMEAYEDAKLEFFTSYAEDSCKRFESCINSDDRVGRKWIKKLRDSGKSVLSYSMQDGDLTGHVNCVTVKNVDLCLSYHDRTVELRSQIGGHFNAQNLLAAASGLLALGYSLEDCAQGLAHVTPVPGRFESVANSLDVGVIVDYAHTPDALKKLLSAVRGLAPKRIITVFGCGGDRDRSKRPKMAQAACEGSDFVIVTSDNPRTEDPDRIIDDVCLGIRKEFPWKAISDRREAVLESIRIAERGDVVVIAGKGHEDYQIIGRTKYPMDDRELARSAFLMLEGSSV